MSPCMPPVLAWTRNALKCRLMLSMSDRASQYECYRFLFQIHVPIFITKDH